MANQKIYALTREGRELEITRFDEFRCLAYEHSGNAYPMLQAVADLRGLSTEQRGLRYHIAYVGMRATWADIEELYAKYMRDPIVWVLTETGEYNYPETGRPVSTPPPFDF